MHHGGHGASGGDCEGAELKVRFPVIEVQRQALSDRKVEPVPFRVVRRLVMHANQLGLEKINVKGLSVTMDRGDWVFDLVVEEKGEELE